MEQVRSQVEASAVGQAVDAHRRGDRIFQIQLRVSELIAHESVLSRSTSAVAPIPGAGGILGRIEAIGWDLHHVGYVFLQTGTRTQDMAVHGTTSSATTGEVAGVYLFRRTAA
jgi:hypothetical protein